MIIHNVTQGTDEWFAIRCGIPTTSAFSSMVTSTGNMSKSIDDYAITLAADLFAGKSLDEFQGNHYTERGIALEPEARNFYEVQKNIDVQEVGFITDDLHTWGCSPDGLVSDGLGMLEIKCQIPKNHIKKPAKHQLNIYSKYKDKCLLQTENIVIYYYTTHIYLR